MDFDLSRIAVPFRMQPGLQRLPADARHLTPLAPGCALWQEKKRLLDAGVSRLVVPGFDQGPVIEALLAQSAREGIAATEPIELAFEEDFAVLDGPSTTLPWLCVSVPSHWAPEEKLGLPFTSVHAPVADGEAIVRAARHLTALATSGDHFERFVWTVTPSGRYDHHPVRHARTPWPDTQDPADFARQCFLRSERQTFLPIPATPGQALFTIRVMLQPLEQAVRTRDAASRLHDSLQSMTDAVLAYKNLGPARDRLLAWLAQRAR